MGRLKISSQTIVLFCEDAGILALVTILGFATHGSLATAGSRLLTTFIPILLAWWLAAIPTGCYLPANYLDLRKLWIPFWAMILAGPLAAFFRSLMLGGAAILPVFVFVLTGVSALGILAWRAVYALIKKSRAQ